VRLPIANWQAGASIDSLRKRAEMLARIRDFFAEKNVLEVETPLLANATVTDVYIESLQVNTKFKGKSKILYLQTSPEFSMKRLLGSGSGPIYQICKAFREGETSTRHNPEFTMLEWYQPGYSMTALMDEVAQLLAVLLNYKEIPRYSYREVFLEKLDIDPHAITLEDLAIVTRDKIDIYSRDLGKTEYLQLLMAHVIEPMLAENFFVYDFPVEQAALAKLEQDEMDVTVAKRFELFCEGMEIANGYDELIDAGEQRIRFKADAEQRRKLKLSEYAADEKFLAALDAGIPECAGVAIGIDRLLMLRLGVSNIRDVIGFTTELA
jgi:lysyl-tRNA synthetase class 2